LEEADLIQKHQIHHLAPWKIREIGLQRAAESLKAFTKRFSHIYLTIDSDALDPAFAPGIANPEFNGLTPDELLSLALAAVDDRLLGFDLVEVCPNYDTGVTAAAAARIIFDVITQAEMARKR